MILVYLTFFSLLTWTCVLAEERLRLLARKNSDWWLDLVGLLMQGQIIPLMQTFLVAKLAQIFFPGFAGIWELGVVAGFLLNFIFVDYLYYWNHRWLHSARMWNTHAVHHSAEHLDILVTSRNTLWTPFLIIYMWMNGLFIYLLQDPSGYIFGATLSACLDMWRHTNFGPYADSRSHRALRWLLITPLEHAWHHSRDKFGVNFGANLSVWDRLHKTYYSEKAFPQAYGVDTQFSNFQKIIYPFPREVQGVPR